MEICDLAKALDAFYEIGKERKECNALVQCFGIKCNISVLMILLKNRN